MSPKLDLVSGNRRAGVYCSTRSLVHGVTVYSEQVSSGKLRRGRGACTRGARTNLARAADPRGERVPAGAGLARLAGGRGAGRGAAQADGAVQAVLALVQHRLRRRGARLAGAARHRRGAPVVALAHRDGRVAARAHSGRTVRRAPQLIDAII